jgi:hypothetical protein
MPSTQHERKLAAAIKKMGRTLSTHTRSTFKPSGAGSRTLEEFKGRRAAEKLGLLTKPALKFAARSEMDANTAKVTNLTVRRAG